MRVYFIKDFIIDGRLHKAGSNATLWDATAAIRGKYAIPYNERFAYEPQGKQETAAQSSGKEKEDRVKATEKKRKNNQKGG